MALSQYLMLLSASSTSAEKKLKSCAHFAVVISEYLCLVNKNSHIFRFDDIAVS